VSWLELKVLVSGSGWRLAVRVSKVSIGKKNTQRLEYNDGWIDAFDLCGLDISRTSWKRTIVTKAHNFPSKLQFCKSKRSNEVTKVVTTRYNQWLKATTLPVCLLRPHTASEIVLPSIGQWAEHLSSILPATGAVAFDGAFNRFIGPDAKITSNDEEFTWDSYKQFRWVDKYSCHLTEVNFFGVLEVPVFHVKLVKVNFTMQRSAYGGLIATIVWSCEPQCLGVAGSNIRVAFLHVRGGTIGQIGSGFHEESYTVRSSAKDLFHLDDLHKCTHKFLLTKQKTCWHYHVPDVAKIKTECRTFF
jgi:hypothetical protein